MATYSITEDTQFPWVSLITINTENEIDISNDVFNITVKDQLEYFINDYIKEGSTFELEELFKKDTVPTLEISNKSTKYEVIKCFTCGGTGLIKCRTCKGRIYYYLPLRRSPTRCDCFYTEHPGYEICPDCHGYEIEHTVCTDEEMRTETYISNINEYNNSDDESLVRNGIQFWVDGVTRKTMYIRVAAKGQSSTNPDGYEVWNPVTNKYEKTLYVGFTIANFNITLNDKERLLFDCFLIPKIKTSDPYPLEYNPPLSSYYEDDHIISGAIRTDYDWNDDGKGIDNLYVNNVTSGQYSMIYEQYPTLVISSLSSNWVTSVKKDTDNYNETPMYIVKSSAYLNDYLVEASAWDLLSGTVSQRHMTIQEKQLKSYLYNEYTRKKLNLEFELDDYTTYPETIVSSYGGDSISSTMYCYEITQKIEDSSCSGFMRENQVKLELEI